MTAAGHSVVCACHESDAKHPQFSMSKTSMFWDHAAGHLLKKKSHSCEFSQSWQRNVKRKMFKINVKLFKRESVVFVAKVKSRSFHPDVFIIFWPPYWFVMDVQWSIIKLFKLVVAVYIKTNPGLETENRRTVNSLVKSKRELQVTVGWIKSEFSPLKPLEVLLISNRIQLHLYRHKHV